MLQREYRGLVYGSHALKESKTCPQRLDDVVTLLICTSFQKRHLTANTIHYFRTKHMVYHNIIKQHPESQDNLHYAWFHGNLF